MRTSVSPGNVNRVVRIESMIVSKLEYDRPVAPGPPLNRVSRQRGTAGAVSRSARHLIHAVAPCSTAGKIGYVTPQPEITQRDLRSRSREIMDAVEHGQSFMVTRDGHAIAELIPLRRRRRFVSRQEFAAMSRNAPGLDVEHFRADQDAAVEHEAISPYDR